MNIASRGATMAVDWEQRVNFDRLRTHRLDRTKAALEASDLGAMLLFDPNNLRYVTSTAIGTWERDKNIRFALVPRGGEDPILWDFGSAARHHQLYCPWLPESSWRAWVPPMRGAMPDETGIPDALADLIWTELHERGLGDIAPSGHPRGGGQHTMPTDEIAALPNRFVRQTDGLVVVVTNELGVGGYAIIKRREWISWAEPQRPAHGQVAFFPTSAIA